MYWRLRTRIFSTYISIISILFIAYSAIFLASYGIQPWDKISALLGSALLSIVSMYFGYKIERRRHRREKEVQVFEEFLYRTGDLLEYLGRAFDRNKDEANSVLKEVEYQSEQLLREMPTLIRISDKMIQDALLKEWASLEGWLETLSRITTYSIDDSKRVEAFEEIYQSVQYRIEHIRQMLAKYETTI